jgi:CRISPR-associated protein Cas2
MNVAVSVGARPVVVQGVWKAAGVVISVLENWGTRVQYSVFECNLDPARCLLLAEGLRKLICAQDNIRIYRVCQACVGEVILLGQGRPVMRDPDFYEV